MATLTDPLGRQTVNSYDSHGNLTVVDQRNASSQTVKYTCRSFDGYGQVTASTESTTLTNCTGNTTGFGYDSYGNRTSVTDPRFYGQGSPPQTTATYDLGGRQLTTTNELGHTTTNTYNARNQVLTTTDYLSHVTTNTYDALGELKTTTDANNNKPPAMSAQLPPSANATPTMTITTATATITAALTNTRCGAVTTLLTSRTAPTPRQAWFAVGPTDRRRPSKQQGANRQTLGHAGPTVRTRRRVGFWRSQPTCQELAG